MRGVTLFRIEDGRIVSARLYMEEVEEAGGDIDETVRRLAEGARSPLGNGQPDLQREPLDATFRPLPRCIPLVELVDTATTVRAFLNEEASGVDAAKVTGPAFGQ